MRFRKITIVAASLAAFGATSAAATAATPAVKPAPATQAATRQFEGTVVSVNRSARTFRLRDAQRGTVTIKVTSATRFQRVGGFAGLRAGLNRVEANVRRSNGAWVATIVERSGGGGRHSGGGEDR
jgi:Domain of unknown function (DUF5666)